MTPATVVRIAAGAALALAATAGTGRAFQPIPLVPGTYCGPGNATVVVDGAADTVAIEGVVCSFPLIAGDRLQSDKCSTAQGQNETRNFELRVVGSAFFHDGHWYTLCPAPAKAGG